MFSPRFADKLRQRNQLAVGMCCSGRPNNKTRKLQAGQAISIGACEEMVSSWVA